MLFPAVHTRSILFGFVLALAVAAALVAAPAAKGKETTLVAQAGERTGPVRHGAPPQRFHPKARAGSSDVSRSSCVRSASLESQWMTVRRQGFHRSPPLG